MSLHDMSVFAGGRRVNLNIFSACICYIVASSSVETTIEKVRVCRQFFFRYVTNTKFVC